MTRRRDRFADNESPARRRGARAKQTKQDIAEELKRLSQEGYAECQTRDLERAKERMIGSRDALAAYLAPGGVPLDGLLGAQRRKRPGRDRPSMRSMRIYASAVCLTRDRDDYGRGE